MEAVDQVLKDRSSMLRLLKANLQEAQNKMKKFADKTRTERYFEVRDWVYLKLHPFKQTYVVFRSNRSSLLDFMAPTKYSEGLGK